ncbi:AMP-binding protein [Acidiferrimicrobium sp. IK]|uniref:AMP-binding protein n=1 Tax=Acidiferrimicrobium sp. IK TaxID=2871700 RepID=UPI0021CB99F8|nr:AMP-binding protein [Acidiferrimicrobium sp. IK]MCU4186742.1 AMP-binding protein [Acidiferrimicrobium sp. IK]
MTLADYLLEGAAARGAHPALVDGRSGAVVSYGELGPAVAAGAARLRALGAGPGRAVAVMAPNQPQWAIVYLAAVSTGSYAVPIGPMLTPGEAAKLLGLARVGLLVFDATTGSAAAEIRRITGIETADLADLEGRVDGAPLPRPRPAPEPVDPSRPAVVAFSSGTTGVSKGVVLTHRNLVAAICQHQPVYQVDEDDTFLAALPFSHIYGLSIILNYGLRHGATIVTMPRFQPAEYWRLIERYRPTWLHIAPPVASLLVDSDCDLSSVRHVVSGAAPLGAALAEKARRRVGCQVQQGYGMTEASPGVTWVPADGTVECPPGSVGVLVPGTEARIVDPVTGDDTDGPGELWVRGPQVMAGYLDAPDATAATLVDGEWLRTGDIVRVDDAGVWWIVDRLKELIKYKGYQVAPAELEGLLLEHPAVIDAAVAGIPDDAAGEIPKAWVVTSRPVAGDELLAWVAERTAPYKKIRAVEFVDAVPRSPTGKVLRRVLRAGGR